MNDKDLLGKADGLMRRGAIGTDTGAVPVLTDFIDPPPVAPIDSVISPPPGSPPAAAPTGDEAVDLATQVMATVEQRLEAEMQRVRRELAQAVADAVREALASRPVK